MKATKNQIAMNKMRNEALRITQDMFQLEKTDPARYCAFIAIIAANLNFPLAAEMTAKHSVEVRNAAIPIMKEIKSKIPDSESYIEEWIEKGIAFVKENWIGRAVHE